MNVMGIVKKAAVIGAFVAAIFFIVRQFAPETVKNYFRV